MPNVMKFLLAHFSGLLRMAAQHCGVSDTHPDFDVTRKPADDTICPIIQIINEDVEQGWSLYWLLVYTTC